MPRFKRHTARSINSALKKAKRDGYLKQSPIVSVNKVITRINRGYNRTLYECVLRSGKIAEQNCKRIINTLIRGGYLKSCSNGNGGNNKSKILFTDTFGNEYREASLAKIKRRAERYRRTRVYMPATVTGKDLKEQFDKQNGRCAYTNQLLTFDPMKNKDAVLASLDRINSNKGYVKGNIQWVWDTVNTMKMALPHDEFVRICKLIAENIP
jgi:hypothetical protein